MTSFKTIKINYYSVGVCVQVCHGVYVEVRGQAAGVAWWQLLLPSKPAHNLILHLKSRAGTAGPYSGSACLSVQCGNGLQSPTHVRQVLCYQATPPAPIVNIVIVVLRYGLAL